MSTNKPSWEFLNHFDELAGLVWQKNKKSLTQGTNVLRVLRGYLTDPAIVRSQWFLNLLLAWGASSLAMLGVN